MAINTHIKQPNEILFALETSTLVFIECFEEVQILMNYSCHLQCMEKECIIINMLMASRSSDSSNITSNLSAEFSKVFVLTQNYYFM